MIQEIMNELSYRFKHILISTILYGIFRSYVIINYWNLILSV